MRGLMMIVLIGCGTSGLTPPPKDVVDSDSDLPAVQGEDEEVDDDAFDPIGDDDDDDDDDDDVLEDTGTPVETGDTGTPSTGTPPTPTPQCTESGLTWKKTAHDASLGIDYVGCDGCDPYLGDTACDSDLPVLCILQDGRANPGITTTYSEGWAQGAIALTAPVSGCSLTSLLAADTICETQLGAGWRMAEWHDGGGGWGFWAEGNISDANPFWTFIDDQYSNCWD